MRITHLLFTCLVGSFHSFSQDFEAKADSLMQLMTLQEKIGQTAMYSGSWDQTGPIVRTNNGKFIREGNMGAMLNAFTVEGTRKLQKVAVEDLKFYNRDMTYTAEPGEFEIAIAPSSDFKFNNSFKLND